MSTAIPEWNLHGVLPQIVVNATEEIRSPYRVSLPDVVLRFGNYRDRWLILNGFMRFRQRLHALGLTSGYQWLDGSFVEDTEVLLGRQPRDIDVVTFYSEPSGQTQQELVAAHPDIFSFDHAHADARKKEFLVDSFMISLSGDPSYVQEQTCMWHDTWSRRRNGVRKGYVRVDLDPTDDQEALDLLQDAKTKINIP